MKRFLTEKKSFDDRFLNEKSNACDGREFEGRLAFAFDSLVSLESLSGFER